jgi:hypothetical protein
VLEPHVSRRRATAGTLAADTIAPVDLASAVAAAPDRFGLTSRPAHVERLGAGETYQAWRVGSGDQDVVVRVARLHQDQRPGSVLTADHFRDSLAWWRDHHPAVVDQVAHLVPLVAAQVEPTPPAPRHTLVHGDAVATNILVDDAGTPRYIDREWADFGDPAQELASLGGALATPPWYVPLSRAALAHFLAAYQEIHPDETLPVRRAARELCERFSTSLHLRTQPHRQQTAAHLTGAVEAQLDQAARQGSSP